MRAEGYVLHAAWQNVTACNCVLCGRLFIVDNYNYGKSIRAALKPPRINYARATWRSDQYSARACSASASVPRTGTARHCA